MTMPLRIDVSFTLDGPTEADCERNGIVLHPQDGETFQDALFRELRAGVERSIVEGAGSPALVHDLQVSIVREG